ncbi:ACSM3 synthetase, partial [Ifrita kowaldi]|nr:ACSM3 synthetase [Ifrita kowaldi]
RYWMNLTPSDIMWNTSDTGWVKAAWSSLFAPWICGSCVFVHNMPQFKPEVIAETLSRYPITTFCTAPTAFRMLVQHDVSRYCREGREAGVAICANMKGMKIKPGSLGKAVPPYDVQIVDDRGAAVPAGEEGTIAVRVQPTRPFCLFSQYL